MINKKILIICMAYTGIGLVAYVLTQAAALSAADAGGAGHGWLGAVSFGVRYLLLQPVAAWLVDRVAWWTLGGLGRLVLVGLLNAIGASLVVAAATRAIVGRRG